MCDRSKRNKRNKRQGAKWESDIIKGLSNLFNLVSYNLKNRLECQIGSSKALDKTRDSRGIDIWWKRLNKNKVPECLGVLCIQAKKTLSTAKGSTKIDIDPLLNMEIEEGEIPLLYTRVTEQKKVQEGTITEVVTLTRGDFEKLFLTAYYLQNKNK